MSDQFEAMTTRFLASGVDALRWAYRLTHDVVPSNTGFSEVEAAKQLAIAFVDSERGTPTREEASAIVRLAWLFVQMPVVGDLRLRAQESGDQGGLLDSPELRTLLLIAEEFCTYVQVPDQWDDALGLEEAMR